MNLRIWSAAAPILLLLSACSQGTQGILASIEREQKVHSAGGLSTTATVTHMAEFAGSYYIAGGGALFHRAIVDAQGNQVVQWSKASVTSGGEYTNFMAVGTAGGTLFAVGNQGATDSDTLFSSTDGATWTPVTLSGSERATDLIPIRKSDGVTADSLLLVVTPNTNDGTYRYVRIIDSTGSIGSDIDLGFAYGFPVTGAANNGTDYYFANNDEVFYYSAPGTSATQVTGTDMGGIGYYSVILLPSGTFSQNSVPVTAVITNSNAAMFWGSLSGGVWTEVGKITDRTDIVGSDVFFGSALLQNSTNFLWIGTLNSTSTVNEGAGIASLSSSMSFALQPPGGMDINSYESTIQVGNGQYVDMETAQIQLLFPASDGSIFAGTAAQGLWRWNPVTTAWTQQ